MKVFVTGGTGFIGKNIVKLLLESGHEYNCLVRGSSKKTMLESMGSQLFTGDITDKTSLIEGMAGCDTVINLANLYSLWEPDITLYKTINVNGTRNVMEATLETDIKGDCHLILLGMHSPT